MRSFRKASNEHKKKVFIIINVLGTAECQTGNTVAKLTVEINLKMVLPWNELTLT